MSAKTQEIQAIIDAHPVVLFMKGTAKMPMCGFSASVVGILDSLGVSYKDVNILADEDLRQELKTFSDWPTFPQVYVAGALIGGADITREMYSSGELQQLLAANGIKSL